MKKSNSYPESIKNKSEREFKEVVIAFKEKDQDNAERMAELGSPSSRELQIKEDTWANRCCSLLIRWGEYILEKNIASKREDFLIQERSYSGVYYFVKWVVRSVFFLFFSTLGSIAGKEVWCGISSGQPCASSVIELVSDSPNIVASILGFLFGLLVGQWLGRIVWDTSLSLTVSCLKRFRKYRKIYLSLLSLFVYLSGIASFGLVFFFFVDVKGSVYIGCASGVVLGLFLAVISYRKNSDCRSVKETPFIGSSETFQNPPELII